MNAWLEVISEPVGLTQVHLGLPGLECLLPIALLCGICILATAIWALAASKYVQSQSRCP